MATVFKEAGDFSAAEQTYSLLPFRFIRLDTKRYVAVNEVGEWQVLMRPDLEALVRRRLHVSTALYRALQSKHFIHDPTSSVWRDLLTLDRKSTRLNSSHL